MTSGNKHGGYTIIEVMIFLAVSGALLVIASLAINGKQAQADFFLSVSDYKTKLDDVINDISTGYYPDAGQKYLCGYSGGVLGAPISFAAGANDAQAKHDECVFLGKVLYFNLTGGSAAPSYSVITVAGGRLNAGGSTISTLFEAHPRAVYPDPNLVTTEKLDRGLVVTKVYVNNISQAAFGIFTSLPQAAATLVSGSLTSNVIGVPSSAVTDNLSPNTTDKIKNIGNPLIIDPSVVICLRQGATSGVKDRRAAMVIGSQGRQVTTEQHIGDVDTAAVTNFTGGVPCPS